jgi:hypothetical protein
MAKVTMLSSRTSLNHLPMRLLSGGMALLAALAFLRPGVLPDSRQPYVHAYPYAVLGVGGLLGCYFNRLPTTMI